MSPYDGAGRIHKKAFLVTNIVLFAFCLASTCARYYVRAQIQKEFTSDDGILLFGIICLIVAMALLGTFIDKMYAVGASESGNLDVAPPDDFINEAFSFQKLVTVALVLTWTSMACVKFSYLFLFRRLISRLPFMVRYWWFAVIYNSLSSIYGAIVYGVACPYYDSFQSLQCVFGPGLHKAISFSISQMILDLVGDILIIIIPIRLIWSVKIRWTQKLALASTLCLTILTILCTVIRIGGIHTGRHVKSMDSVWETYWQFVAANISLTMTAATAFRTFFVSRNERDQRRASNGSWYSRSRQFLQVVIVAPFSWTRTRSRSQSKDLQSSSDRASSGQYEVSPWELSDSIPGANMTGIRTLIGRSGATKTGQSQVVHSVIGALPDDDLTVKLGATAQSDLPGVMV